VGGGEVCPEDGRTALVKRSEMITVAFGVNATVEEEAVNYTSPSDRGGTYKTGNEQATLYVWERFVVCSEIITVVYGQHLIYEKIHHSGQCMKTIQPRASYSGSIPFF